jgi:SAM-dependent methyltransferase
MSPVDEAPEYAFPHAADEEARRLELLQQRLDPLTIRRVERLGVGPGARCLEPGGGRGSITSWLADRVGSDRDVTATDLQVEFLQALELANVEVVRHDVRSDTFPEASFDFVHARAALMHVPVDRELLVRMVSGCARTAGCCWKSRTSASGWATPTRCGRSGRRRGTAPFPRGRSHAGAGYSASCRGAGSPTSPPTPRSTSSGRGRRWPSSIS